MHSNALRVSGSRFISLRRHQYIFGRFVKRGIRGAYICIEPFHLSRYLDEATFRYNNRATKYRNVNDSERFKTALSRIVGKRLTYREVTGKEEVPASQSTPPTTGQAT